MGDLFTPNTPLNETLLLLIFYLISITKLRGEKRDLSSQAMERTRRKKRNTHTNPFRTQKSPEASEGARNVATPTARMVALTSSLSSSPHHHHPPPSSSYSSSRTHQIESMYTASSITILSPTPYERLFYLTKQDNSEKTSIFSEIDTCITASCRGRTEDRRATKK